MSNKQQSSVVTLESFLFVYCFSTVFILSFCFSLVLFVRGSKSGVSGTVMARSCEFDEERTDLFKQRLVIVCLGLVVSASGLRSHLLPGQETGEKPVGSGPAGTASPE